MLITELFDLVSEAPLADFGTFGDPDTEGSFRPDDLRAMKSHSWKKKIENAFKKSPYKFNIYLYNGEEGKAPVIYAPGNKYIPADVKSLKYIDRYAGVQPLDFIEQMIGKLPPDAENSISVILVENEGSNRMPLTPWILVHRIVHSMIYAGKASLIAETFNKFVRRVEVYLNLSDHYKEVSEPLVSSYDRISLIASIIGKMKSAKNKNLANAGEFFVETITQYIINGRVSFEYPILDDEGFSPEHPSMMIPEKYRDIAMVSRDALDFIRRLKIKMPLKPNSYYVSYDANGVEQASGTLSNDKEENLKRIEREKSRGYSVKEFHVTPKQIQTYERKKKAVQNLIDLWNHWKSEGMLEEQGTSLSSQLKDLIEHYESIFNTEIDDMLKNLVGKALVL